MSIQLIWTIHFRKEMNKISNWYVSYEFLMWNQTMTYFKTSLKAMKLMIRYVMYTAGTIFQITIANLLINHIVKYIIWPWKWTKKFCFAYLILISIKNQQVSRKTRFCNRMLLIIKGANYQGMCRKYFISISRQNNKITYYYF